MDISFQPAVISLLGKKSKSVSEKTDISNFASTVEEASKLEELRIRKVASRNIATIIVSIGLVTALPTATCVPVVGQLAALIIAVATAVFSGVFLLISKSYQQKFDELEQKYKINKRQNRTNELSNPPRKVESAPVASHDFQVYINAIVNRLVLINKSSTESERKNFHILFKAITEVATEQFNLNNQKFVPETAVTWERISQKIAAHPSITKTHFLRLTTDMQ